MAASFVMTPLARLVPYPHFWETQGSFIMDIEHAPKDRLIILFQGSHVGVLGRWHKTMGWIAEYKDAFTGDTLIAKVNPTAWIWA